MPLLSHAEICMLPAGDRSGAVWQLWLFLSAALSAMFSTYKAKSLRCRRPDGIAAAPHVGVPAGGSMLPTQNYHSGWNGTESWLGSPARWL
jgi:hypothetical protein